MHPGRTHGDPNGGRQSECCWPGGIADLGHRIDQGIDVAERWVVFNLDAAAGEFYFGLHYAGQRQQRDFSILGTQEGQDSSSLRSRVRMVVVVMVRSFRLIGVVSEVEISEQSAHGDWRNPEGVLA